MEQRKMYPLNPRFVADITFPLMQYVKTLSNRMEKVSVVEITSRSAKSICTAGFKTDENDVFDYSWTKMVAHLYSLGHGSSLQDPNNSILLPKLVYLQ